MSAPGYDELMRALRAFIIEVVRDELRAATSPKPANDEYLSTADAAQIARLTPGTIRRWVREKTLTRHGKGARVRIRRDELERLLHGSPEPERLTPERRAARDFGPGGRYHPDTPRAPNRKQR